VISTAHGLKFTEFKQSYHQGTLAEVDARAKNTPIELAADVDVVRRAIDERLG
jgi:threonine synthase